MSARGYRSFADFERDEIRPGLRAGWSLDSITEPLVFDDDEEPESSEVISSKELYFDDSTE
jgi:hypothetical protein